MKSITSSKLLFTTSILFISYILFVAIAPQTQAKKCDRFPAQDNFSVKDYLGHWFEIARFKDFFIEDNGVCSTASYSLNPNKKGHIIVNNTEHVGSPNGRFKASIGDAYAPNPDNPAKLKVAFQKPFYGPYQVIETDYKQYSMVVSCTEVLGVAEIEFAWILSRTPQLPSHVEKEILQKFEKYDLDTSKFMYTKQKGCWN